MSSSRLIKGSLLFLIGPIIFFGILFFRTASVAQAQEQLSLSISPTLTEVTIAPGDTWTSAVTVTNPNPYDVLLSISLRNVKAADEGGHALLIPTDETPQELSGRTFADWIELSPFPLSIPASSSTQAVYTVAVPIDAEPAGHTAALLFTAQPTGESGTSSAVQVTSAVSTLLFVHVPGDVVESGTITSFSGTSSSFSLTFLNSGNVYLRPKGEVVITNLFGRTIATLPVNQDSEPGYVLPHSSRTFSLPWNDDAIRIGPYQATAWLTYGSQTAQPVSATTTVWILSVPSLSVILSLLMTLFLLVLLMRLVRKRSVSAFIILIALSLLPISNTQAAPLTGAKDTLSDSDVSALSNHTVAYTSSNAVTAGQTIKIQFDPAGDAFNLGTIAASDITTGGMTLVTSCGVGADEVTVAFDTTAPDENATFTVCTGDSVVAGAKTITFGNTKIGNPSTAGSYRITIGGTQTDSGETAVSIIDDVQVTTSINATLSFTIEGVVAGQPNANGDSGTTSVGTTATAIPFDVLSPSTAKTAQQKLTVATNANNGFVVTLEMTALTNGLDDIDRFRDGASTATPQTWKPPNVTASDENFSGHWGITSEDADLNGDEFGTALFAGNFGTARQVFSHNGPSDGVTVNQGTTRIGFKIQTSALQQAGTYTATVMYIVTPTY